MRMFNIRISGRTSGNAGQCEDQGKDIPGSADLISQRVFNHGVHFYPIVLGHEFSGDVVEVGEGVTKVKVGDRVSGAPLLPCMKCDDCQKGNFSLCKHYSFIGSRAAGQQTQIMWWFLSRMRYHSHDICIHMSREPCSSHATVAHPRRDSRTITTAVSMWPILGGGTVGMFTMQWTKIFGSKKVVVFDISDERLDSCKASRRR